MDGAAGMPEQRVHAFRDQGCASQRAPFITRPRLRLRGGLLVSTARRWTRPAASCYAQLLPIAR